MVHKLKIGFTDKENPNSTQAGNGYGFVYNNSDIVCGTLEWEFLDTTPACVVYLDLFKKIISDMHVCQIDCAIIDDIEGVNYSTNVSINTLLPTTHNIVSYQDDDYLAFTNKFNNPGDLYVHLEQSAMAADINYYTTYDYAIENNDFSLLSKDYSYSVCPYIEFDLTLQPRWPDHPAMWKERMESLKKENESLILDAGFELDDPKLTPGELKIAKLLTDHETAFNMIEKYPNICSIEIIEE